MIGLTSRRLRTEPRGDACGAVEFVRPTLGSGACTYGAFSPMSLSFPLANTCINSGAVPLDRSRRLVGLPRLSEDMIFRAKSGFGGTRADQGQAAYRKAAALAEADLQVNPKDATVLGNLGGYRSMLGDRKEALAFSSHSSATPVSPNWLYNMAAWNMSSFSPRLDSSARCISSTDAAKVRAHTQENKR
jgi:hypothetical protein